MAVPGAGKRSLLAKALEKPTGALAVSIEYDRHEHSESSENDLIVLSMQLRKSKAASLWTPSLDHLALISKEQRAAKGNFPGPCPVVFYPPLSSLDATQIKAAAFAGAHAVVMRTQLLDLRDVVQGQEMEVIWDVRSTEEIRAVMDAGVETPIFLLPGADVEAGGLLGALPKGSVGVASVDRGNDEIVLGRSLAKAGVKSVLVRQACDGDTAVDLQYARYAIDSLTSKANPEFQITGIGSSKGSADGRRSFGADSTGRALQDSILKSPLYSDVYSKYTRALILESSWQDKASVQKDINHFHDKPGGTDFKKLEKKGTSW
jgi:hypothetical protein